LSHPNRAKEMMFIGGGCPLPPPPAAAAVVDEVMMRNHTQPGSMVREGHKYNLRK
jgi:hypothetical protein